MKLTCIMDHVSPPRPMSGLMLYQLALEASQAQDVYNVLAEKYWQEPAGHTVPEHQPAGSTDWGLHDMRVMFSCSARKYCNDQVRRIVGDDLNANVHYLMTVARPRLGLKSLDLLSAHNLTELYELWGNILWEKLAKRIQNPAMGVFVQESGSLLPRSTHIPANMLMGLCSSALEGAYGYGFDLVGNYNHINSDDPMSLWVPREDLHAGDPAFIYERNRSLAIISEFDQSKKVAVIGAGWLPEVRHAEVLYGKDRPNWNNLRIYAFDDDLAVPTEFDGHWVTPERAYVIYQRMNLNDTLDRLSARDRGTFDLVYAKDLFTAHPEKLERVMKAVIPVLRAQGKFMFDIVIDHPISRRNILLFGDGDRFVRGELKLMDNVETMAFVDGVIHNVSAELGVILNWRCEIDQQENPLGMLFTVYCA